MNLSAKNFLWYNHKSKYGCENAIYFNFGYDIIKEKCKFAYYSNKTGVTPTVLERGNKITLANWPDDKHIICNVNNDIPVKILSHLYVLVYRSVLCNLGIEAENNFPFKSHAAYHDAESKLVMYFMVNVAFISCLENLPDSLKFPILLNRPTYEQTLPISLKSFDFDSDLLKASVTLKDFIPQFWHQKEIFDLKERHNNNGLHLAYKHFFFNNYTVDIFLFVAVITSLAVTEIVIYTLCKHMRLKSLVTSFALQQIKEVDVVAKQEHVSIAHECTCKIQKYKLIMLNISI